MKVVILAGGLGTRLQEATHVIPKPMVEIGGRPILWHIMRIYHAYGFKEFVVALGYKGSVIKRYFLDYHLIQSDLTISLDSGATTAKRHGKEDMTVHLVDTGNETETGGRLKRLEPWVGNETFMLTYGDGVGNVDLKSLLAFHRSHGKLATVTAVRPPARFGNLNLDGDIVKEFTEKSQLNEGWINGGFFVLEPGVFKYLKDDATIFEAEPLSRLAKERQMAAYTHSGFWQCMDILRDVRLLENLWASGKAPWKTWAE